MLSTITDEAVEAAHKKLWPAPDATFIAPSRDDIRAALTAALPHISSPAPEAQQEPVAYRIHAPEDDYYGTGPDMLQFHPLAQHDIDNGYRQTPLYGRPALELSGNTGELIDKMAEAIRGDTVSDDTPWATLSEDRKIGWRGDAERALAVVKEYLTARRPAPEGHHPDDIAVDRFAAAMKEKLARKREEGRGGWDDTEKCSGEYLSRLLREHVDKGDPVDVGNLAMMLHQRGERIAPEGQQEVAGCEWCVDGLQTDGETPRPTCTRPSEQAVTEAGHTPKDGVPQDALAIIEKMRAEIETAENYLRDLLTSFVTEHFPNNESWKLLSDLLGMLSQMDNASTVARDYKARLAEAVEVLRPFADTADHDIGSDEADSDTFHPMTNHNRAAKITVGDMRRARAFLQSLGKEGGQDEA